VLTIDINCNNVPLVFYIFFMARLPLFGPWSPHCRSFTITLKHTELLWTIDQPVAETCTWQQTALRRDRYQCPWWDSNPHSQESSDRRLTP